MIVLELLLLKMEVSVAEPCDVTRVANLKFFALTSYLIVISLSTCNQICFVSQIYKVIFGRC